MKLLVFAFFCRTLKAMSPITNYPQSPGAGGAESFGSRSKRAASPQRVSNGYASPKSNSILSPRKSSKRFFRRPTLEKNQSSDCSTHGNEKKKQSNSHPRVEIIYKDASSENESDKETMVSSLKKAFEADGTQSSYSEDGAPSTLSEQSASHCLDVNMNRISTASGSSHTERVVQEIVLTEQAYVSHLQEIIEGYLEKMRNEKSPFSELDIKDLFMNIEEIYEFNKSFLAELEICGDDPVEVANLFVSKETGFVTYTEYCTNYPISMEVLTKSTQKKETAEFIKKIQVELGHSLPLGSYLLKPVQRILKYHLLLQDIQKHFDKENDPEGYDVISDALSTMTGVAHHINEMKRQHEVAVHVQEIQSQMCDFEGPDLTTYGSLVLEDTFRMHGTRTDRYLFLFEQILLITKRKENGYSCKATLMLSNMMMLESVPKEPLAFQIIRFDNQKITYTFLARNKDQKRQWMLELKRLIVDSLSAQVPTKAKNLILGKKSVGETKELETPDTEGKKRSSSIDSKVNRGAQLKGSSGFTGMKREKVSIKSDDESEPRSPSEAYSSDDDKKPLRSHSSVSDREESLDECEEPVEEKRRNSDHRVSTPINESSEDDAEEKFLNHEAPEAQPRTYSVQDSRGEVVGTTATEGVGFVSQIKNDEQSEAEVTNTTREGFTASSGIRQRSSSLSSCDSVKEARNRKSVTRNGSFNNKASCEVGSFAHASCDSPSQIRRSSSGVRLLEARRSLEKSSSALDLRDVDEDSASAFSHGDIENFMEYSAIQTTVRKVSRAFSGSSPPPDKTSPSEIQMRTAQTRYIVESRNAPDKDSSVSSSDSTQQNLEELLASIDRDLDETRRTISCAQLLESALLIKNDGRPLNTETEFTNSLTRKRRPRIIDFTTEKTEPQLDKSRSCFSDERNGEREQSEHVNCLRGEAFTNTTVYSEQERECNSSGEKNGKDKQELSISNEIEQSQAFALSAGSEPQGDQVDEPSQAVDQNQPQKRVFELFADSKSEKPSTAIEEDVFEETATHVITPKKSSLPSVHKMARQYSRKVAEKQTVENIRTRARNKVRDKIDSNTAVSDTKDNTDHTPKIKIEKVTKVSFTSTPIESYKLVRRRRRRSGSSRHRSDDLRRLSWSVEKVKPESEEPRKTRPKSVYDMEALEATLTENMEQIEEGLEPMLIEGLEKDDVVVRGLVQHLVNKFNSHK